ARPLHRAARSRPARRTAQVRARRRRTQRTGLWGTGLFPGRHRPLAPGRRHLNGGIMTAWILPDQFKALRSDYIDKQVVSSLVSLTLDDLSPGELIVRTRYAGVNYKDCLSIRGKAKVITSYPRIAGIELVGDVVASSVDAFSSGQTIMAHGFQTGIAFDGGFAEYARGPAAHAVGIPAGLSPWQAAMMGVPGFTAAMALERFQQLGIGPDAGTIAVSGATGAVGILSLLVLSRAGYRVAALTRRMEEEPALRAL